MAAGILAFSIISPLSPVMAKPGNRLVTVKDFRGQSLVFDRPVNRIVCLIDSALTGFYMLGVQKKIVGVSKTAVTGSSTPYYAVLDPRIRQNALPVVSSQTAGSLERILALKPELVVVWALNHHLIQALEQRGVPVFGVFIEKTGDIYKEIIAFGKLTGTLDRAQTLVRETKDDIARIKKTTETLLPQQKPNAYFMWAKGELDSGGSKSIIQELLNISGAVNICGNIDQEHVVMNLETLIAANPDIIIMWHNPLHDPEKIGKKAAWKDLNAARNSRIHEIPGLFSYDLWTLNFVNTAKLMARWCHPDLFHPHAGTLERKAR